MDAERSHTLPIFKTELPFPVYDLFVAVVTVCLFIPVVILIHHCFLAHLMRPYGYQGRKKTDNNFTVVPVPATASYQTVHFIQDGFFLKSVWFSSGANNKEYKPDSESKTWRRMDPRLQKWLWEELTQMPNLVSLGRLVSGPFIATMIIQESWLFASISLTVAAASDWFDGFLAKRMNKKSVMGSFLDPLADKTLIGATVCALLWQGSLPYWAVAPIIARDISLILGTYIHYTISGTKQPMSFYQHLQQMQNLKGRNEGYIIQPLFISKLNTVLQLMLIVSCIGQSWMDYPSKEHVTILAKLTVTSTFVSWFSYTWGYLNGNKVIL